MELTGMLRNKAYSMHIKLFLPKGILAISQASMIYEDQLKNKEQSRQCTTERPRKN